MTDNHLFAIQTVFTYPGIVMNFNIMFVAFTVGALVALSSWVGCNGAVRGAYTALWPTCTHPLVV